MLQNIIYHQNYLYICLVSEHVAIAALLNKQSTNKSNVSDSPYELMSIVLSILSYFIF